MKQNSYMLVVSTIILMIGLNDAWAGIREGTCKGPDLKIASAVMAALGDPDIQCFGENAGGGWQVSGSGTWVAAEKTVVKVRWSGTLMWYRSQQYDNPEDSPWQKEYAAGGAHYAEVTAKAGPTTVGATNTTTMIAEFAQGAETRYPFLLMELDSVGRNRFSNAAMNGLLAAIYKSLEGAGLVVPFEDSPTEEPEPQAAEAPDQASAEEAAEEDLCGNGKKDPDEEGRDCGGPCRPCRTELLLDRSEFTGNFNGQDTLQISGRVVKELHPYKEELNPGQPGISVDLKGFGKAGSRIKAEPQTTGPDGKFTLSIVLPEVKERYRFAGKQVGLNIRAKNQNRLVYITQTSSVPRIINARKNTPKPAGNNSWATFSFEVADQEDDVETVLLYAPSGKLRWANKKTGTLEKGEEGNLSAVAVTGPYPGGPISFSWMAPPMGLRFDADLLDKLKSAYFGSGSAASAGMQMANDELLAFGTSKLEGKAGQIAAVKDQLLKANKAAGHFTGKNAYGKFIDNKAMKDVKTAKNLKALGFFDRFMNGYKLYQSGTDTVKSMAERTRVIVREAENSGEGVVQGMLIAMEGISLIEGGMAAVMPEAVQKWMDNKNLSQLRKFTYGMVLNGMKGSLEFAADTYKAERATLRTRRVTLLLQAVDKTGNVSPIYPLPVDVAYYSAGQEVSK